MLSRGAGVPRRASCSPNPEAALPAPLPLPLPPSPCTRASRLRLSYRAARSKAPASPLRGRQPVSRTRASLRPERGWGGRGGVSLSGRGGVARVGPGVRRAQTCWRCAPDPPSGRDRQLEGDRRLRPERLGTESWPGRWRPGFQALVEDVPGARRWRETSGRTPRPCAGSTHAVRSAPGFSPPTFLLSAWGRFLPAPLCPGGDPGGATTLDPWAMGEGQSIQWRALQGVQSSVQRPQGCGVPNLLYLVAAAPGFGGGEVTPIPFVNTPGQRLEAKALLGFAWRPGEGQVRGREEWPPSGGQGELLRAVGPPGATPSLGQVG